MQIKNKKQIISTIATILVSTFLVAGVVFAVTTISSDGISTTGTLTGLTKITIGTSGATTKALQIHSHQMADVSGTADPGVVANEFKGEFLNTASTMDGIAAHYRMSASGTGVLRSIIGVAYLDSGVTLSGTSATGSWISGILGSVNVAGKVDGTAVTVTGVYGGLGSMTGGTLTQVNDMSAIWADSQVIKVPTTGDSQLLLMTNGAGATLGQAIKIDASDRITNFIKFDNAEGAAGGGDMITINATEATQTTGTAKIKILIDNVPYYINAYDKSNN